MRIAYLECFSGISGDMFMGALVDAGVSTDLFKETVAGLKIGATLEFSRVTRNGISATKADVFSHGEKDLPREVYWQKRAESHRRRHEGHEDHHSHSHEGGPVQLLEHNYASSAAAPEPHDHGRGLTEIRAIISAAAISESAKKTAIAIFAALGAAEAKIHNSDVDAVHFHEVGAVDAMVDIVCAAVGAEALNVDEIVCSPLNVGGGTVQCAHGTLPVPAPATLELLQDAPVYSSGIQAELVTPTGAAIVHALAKRFVSFPAMKIVKTGYGAGSRDFPGHANVVRLTIGETGTEMPAASDRETISVLEANLDDLNPQVFGYAMDRLLTEGALDVFAMPLQMKKNRPGMLLSVLCRPGDASRLTQVIFAETSTLGIRRRDETRQVLDRRWATVATQWGDVRLKIGSMNGTVTNYAPEYEDCRRIASEQHVPLKSVMEAALQSYLRSERH